jgi:hypothetical protein
VGWVVCQTNKVKPHLCILCLSAEDGRRRSGLIVIDMFFSARLSTDYRERMDGTILSCQRLVSHSAVAAVFVSLDIDHF